jgi:hypothetical protein
MLKHVQSLSASEVPPSKPKFWLRSGHVLKYTAPKSIAAIRDILWRIKRLVSG